MAQQWIRSGDIAWEELDGEAVLVSCTTKKTWVLNRTAAFVWKHCDGRVSIERLARRLARAGGQGLETVRCEIGAFCQELAVQGLLLPARRQAITDGVTASFLGFYLPPVMQARGSGGGMRGRPSPRSVSGPP